MLYKGFSIQSLLSTYGCIQFKRQAKKWGSVYIYTDATAKLPLKQSLLTAFVSSDVNTEILVNKSGERQKSNICGSK